MKFVSSHGLSKPYQKAVEGHSPWQSDDPNPSPICIPEIASAETNGSLKALIVGEGI
jgi:hypothetical protein